MRTATIDYWSVIYPDANVWKQERNFVTISGIASIVLKYPATSPTYMGTFYKGADDMIHIDVSELYRTNASGTLRVADPEAQSEFYLDIDWNVIGLINPARFIIPANDLKNGAIIWPYKILKDIGIPNNVELWNYSASGGVEYLPSGSAYNNARQMTIPVGTGIISGAFASGTEDFARIIDGLLCEKTYACVQWVSRSGIIKRATMEIKAVTDASINEVEIERIDAAFDVRKGQLQSLQLYLDGLNAYDFWYYSDIVTSSDVRVALSSSDYDSINDTIKEENKVQVTTQSVEQPNGDGGQFNVLSINVKYKQYDAI